MSFPLPSDERQTRKIRRSSRLPFEEERRKEPIEFPPVRLEKNRRKGCKGFSLRAQAFADPFGVPPAAGAGDFCFFKKAAPLFKLQTKTASPSGAVFLYLQCFYFSVFAVSPLVFFRFSAVCSLLSIPPFPPPPAAQFLFFSKKNCAFFVKLRALLPHGRRICYTVKNPYVIELCFAITKIPFWNCSKKDPSSPKENSG